MNLPSPYDRSLADCMHFARFVAKARLLLADELEPEYADVFGHQHGVDGQFLGHFGFKKEAFLEVVKANDDAGVVTWLQNKVDDFEDKRTSWNELAPNLGREGFPMHKVFRIVCKRIYRYADWTPQMTVFELIDIDEGRG